MDYYTHINASVRATAFMLCDTYHNSDSKGARTKDYLHVSKVKYLRLLSTWGTLRCSNPKVYWHRLEHAKTLQQTPDALQIFILCLMMKRAATDSELPGRSGPQMSSIFGQSQSAPQASGSTSAFPPTSSLFADLATSKPDQKPLGNSSLFSSAGGQSKPESSTIGFGGVSLNSQPQTNPGGVSGGLFGSVTSQSQGSSIFANTVKPSAPLNLGNTATTTAPSLFGSNTTTSAPFASTGFLSQPQQQQEQQAGQPQSQNGQTAGNATQNTQPAFFNSLLEKGKKRARDGSGGSGSGDLPSLQLGLGDIARRARELGGTGQQAQKGGVADSRA